MVKVKNMTLKKFFSKNIYVIFISLLFLSSINAEDIVIKNFSDYTKIANVTVGNDSTKRSIDEYVMGVVFGEVRQFYADYSENSYEVFKAMSVAARTMLIQRITELTITGYIANVPGTSGFQRFNNAFFDTLKNTTYNEHYAAVAIKSAVTNTAGQIMVCGSDIFKSNYFGKNSFLYTLDSEDAVSDGIYRVALRRVLNDESDIDAANADNLPGMSQAGAMTLALNGAKYLDILRHYYGATPPIVQEVKIRQNSIEKYHALWSPKNGPRTKSLITNNPIDPLQDLEIVILFDEYVDVDYFDLKIKNTGNNNEVKADSLEEHILGTNLNYITATIGYAKLKNLGSGETQLIISVKDKGDNYMMDSDPSDEAIKPTSLTITAHSGYQPGVDTNHKFVVAPKGSVLFQATNNDNTVLVSNANTAPTPIPTDTAAVSYAAAPVATVVNIADFVKGIMYGATGGADFSAGKYKEGYKAIGAAAYTLLLHEQNKNDSKDYDILVNGYLAGQKYYIPYKDYSSCTGTIKIAIDKAFSEIAVTTTAFTDGNTVTSYYIKAFGMDNITIKSKISNSDIPDIKTLVFPYISNNTTQTVCTAYSEREIGEYKTYLRQTPYDENAGVAKPGDMANCTKVGMSAWGAMQMAAAKTATTADDILNVSYHYEPAKLGRLKLEYKESWNTNTYDSSTGVTATSAKSQTTTAYDVEWGLPVSITASGTDFIGQCTVVNRVTTSAKDISLKPKLYIYLTEKAKNGTNSPEDIQLGFKNSTSAGIEVPVAGGFTEVTNEADKAGYPAVYYKEISASDVDAVLNTGNGTVRVCVTAYSKVYNDNLYGNISLTRLIDSDPSKTFFYLNSQSRNILLGEIHSDEYHTLSFVKAADADPAKSGTSYNVHPELVTPNADVSGSFNLHMTAPDMNINWSKLFGSLNINFTNFDLLAAMKGLGIDVSCLDSHPDEKAKLQSVNLQNAEFAVSHVNDKLEDFIKNNLKIQLPCSLDFKGITFGSLFSMPQLNLSGINIPRLDLFGCKWGLDMSHMSIAFFGDSGHGTDVWNMAKGLFNFSLNFRGIKGPQLVLPKINTGLNMKGLGDTIGMGGASVCNPLNGAGNGIMNQIDQSMGGAGKSNIKIIASGTGGNAILDYLSNTQTGLGNTSNAKIADDISSVAVAGAFLAAGGIDQGAVNKIMEFQKVANDVSVGMALLGGIQMIPNPAFALYLLQGAIGYAKTWAEGMIKAYCFKSVSQFLQTTVKNNEGLIDSIGARLPGGLSFPGYGGKHFDYAAIQGMMDADDISKAVGCSNDAKTETWNLEKLNWNDVREIAGEVAKFIQSTSESKNDLMKGSEWLSNFSSRDLGTISANVQNIKRLTVKASGGSGKAPLTVNEEMMSTLSQVLQLLHYIPEPITSGIANVGPIIVSIFSTSSGNLMNTVKSQLGSDNPAIVGLKNAVAEKGAAIFKEMKLDDFPKLPEGITSILPIKLDFIPFLGDLISQVVDSLSYGHGSEADVSGMLEDVDEPGTLGIFYPYRAQASNSLESYKGWIVGVTTNNAVMQIKGYASDYLPQFLQVYAQADNGPVVTTVLKIDTTLVTTADGKRGQADWDLDVPIPHAGANTVKVWTTNAGGHRVDMQFTAYLAGTSFPQENARAIPVSSYIWRAYDSWLLGIGEHVVKEGGGIINFLSTDPGEMPLTEVIIVDPPAYGGKKVVLYYPDNTANTDLDMVDETGVTVCANNAIPSDGRFRFRLKGRYTGKSFVTVMGSADAAQLKEWRLEYAKGWLNNGNTDNAYFGETGGIVTSNVAVQGPLFQVMNSWDVWSSKLSGQYTLRTTIDDGNENYYHVSGTAEMDRVHFTIGTPIDVSNTAATIVTDPYMKFGLLVPAWAVKKTEYVNVYSEKTDPVKPLQSDKYSIITSKYGVYPPLNLDAINAGVTMTVTIKYTADDLNINNFADIFSLTDTAMSDYSAQVEKAKGIIESNLGIYRETDLMDNTGNTVTVMEHMTTQHPLGSYQVYTAGSEAKGRYFILPADCGPILRYPAVASPFIFNPEEESKGRTCTAIYFSPMATTSKYVFADIKIMDYDKTRVVRDLYRGIEDKKAIELKYAGKYGDIDEYKGRKYYFYNFKDEPSYRNILAAPLNGIIWDGVGTKKDGTSGIVEDGIYRAMITLMDSFGNSTTGSCMVVKGRIVPQIMQIGGLSAADGMTVSADVLGDTTAVAGTATGAEAFSGYMMGYRASGFAADIGSNNEDDGYTYINLPAEYTGGTVTNTVKNMQITSGRLADWDISSLYNGYYDLRLFILGTDDSGEIKVLDRATIKNISVKNPDGLYNLKAVPNPFSSSITITVNANTNTPDGVNFIIKDSAANTVTSISAENTQGVKYSAVWDATGQADGYYNISVTAGTYVQQKLIRKWSSVANIKAVITTPAAGASISGDMDIIGSAKVTDAAGNTIPVNMAYYELYRQVDNGGWVEVQKSDEPVENGTLGSVYMADLKGDKLDLRLVVVDNAGNSVTVENKGIEIKFTAAFTAGPLTLVKGGEIPVNFVYDINKVVDSAEIHVNNSSGVPVRLITLNNGYLESGSHMVSWDGTNDSTKNQVPVGVYYAYIKLARNSQSYTVPETSIAINVCDLLGNTAGAAIDSNGMPRPYFDYTVTGSGKYDNPIPVTYTVTGFATENWNTHPMVKIEHPNASTNNCFNARPVCAYWPGNSSDTMRLPWNQTVTGWTEHQYNNGDNKGILWINGNENDFPVNGIGSSANTQNYYIYAADSIRLEARAKKPDCYTAAVAKTWANLKRMQVADVPDYYNPSGSINGKDVLYYHRLQSSSFAITMSAKNNLDYPNEPQHGIISSPFNYPSDPLSSSTDNGTRPSVTYNNIDVKSILTGWGGNTYPKDGYYHSASDNTSTNSIWTGVTRNAGYQEGTINHAISKEMDITMSASVSLTFNLYWQGVNIPYTKDCAVTGALHINNAPFGSTTVVINQIIDISSSAKTYLPGIPWTLKSYNSKEPQAVQSVYPDGLSVISFSNIINNQNGTLTMDVTITRQPLESAWAITNTARARDNTVIFEQGVSQTGQAVNIFQSLNNVYGSSVNPFPNSAEYANVTTVTKTVPGPGPDSVPHSSSWNIKGPYYPDSSDAHDDVVMAKGMSVTSFSNTSLSFTSVTSTATDGFEQGKTYDEYDIDKVQLKLREPSAEPYESRTYIKISGSANIGDFKYYSLSYKKSDTLDGDSYHQFKYSTVTASGVLGYLPVKDKIGIYDIMMTVVNTNNQAVQLVKKVEIGHAISADSGGTATDAYEQAFLFFPAGALRQDKMITITPLKRDDVAELADNLIPAALIYSFEAANIGASSPGHLRTDDFTSDSLGNIPKPAVLTMLYDTRQLNGFEEAALSLYKLDVDATGNNTLRLIPSVIDRDNKVITSELTSFSTVQLIPNYAPPTYDFLASPNPAGRESTVNIYVKSTKTLESGLAGSVYLSHENKSVAITFTAQDKPYMNGKTAIKRICESTYVDDDKYRLILGTYTTKTDTFLPCDGLPNTYLAGMSITLLSDKGASKYVIKRSGVYVDDMSSKFTTKKFWVSLVANLTSTAEVDLSKILFNNTTWQCMSKSGNAGNDVVSNCYNRIELVSTAPGEQLAFPPVNWWNNKRIVIKGVSYYLKKTGITGNEITGAAVSAMLATAPASAEINITDVLDNTSWVMYAPVSEYMATFKVSDYVLQDVSETAQVSYDGRDLLGNTGSGRGTFVIDTKGPVVTVATDKDIAKLGDTIIVRAKSYLNGVLPFIRMKTTGTNLVTLTVKTADVSYSVIDGTDIKTGEAGYNYTVLEPELKDYSGIVEVGASVTSTSGVYYYAAKTITVDAVKPVITIGPVLNQPIGIGMMTFTISSSETLQSAPQLKISALTENGWITTYPYVDNFYTDSGMAKVEIKAIYKGTSICAEAVGYDMAGNSGYAKNIIKIDTMAPGQLQNLKGKRQTPLSADVLTWDSLTGTTYDLAGYYVYMDDTLITALPVTITSYTKTLVGSGFNYDLTANHKYYVAGVDKSGNIGTGAYVTVYNDSTAPVTYVEIEGTSLTASNGTIYLNTLSLIKLVAEDTAAANEASTSVKSTGYNFNKNEPENFNTYGDVFACPYSNTTTALYYRSVDINGNSEDVKQSNIFVDSKAPTVNIRVAGPYYNGYTINGKAVVPPDGFENWDRATILGSITTTVKSMSAEMLEQYTDAQLKELLGYVIYASSNTPNDKLETLDKTVLICDVTTTAATKFLPVSYDMSGLENMDNNSLAVLLRSLLTVSPEYTVKFVNKYLSGFYIDAYDDFDGFTGSGVARINYRMDTDSALLNIPATKVGLSGLAEGLHSMEAVAVDNVGNSLEFTGTGNNMVFFIVDASAPSSSAYITTGYDSATITAVSASVTLTATNIMLSLTALDNGPVPSGVYKTYYSVDGAGYSEYTEPINIKFGTGIVSYYSVDMVLNTENPRTINFEWYMPTATVTQTSTMTQTITPTVTCTNTQTVTQTMTVTNTETSSVTDTITETSTSTITNSITQTVTKTITETITPTNSQTVTQTGTPTVTDTATQSVTRTFTATGTNTRTCTITKTATATVTKTGTVTSTYTKTPTATATMTLTRVPAHLKLYFKAGNLDVNNPVPHPQFKVYNTGNMAVDISKIEIRYWYKYEGIIQAERSYIDWAGVNGTNISGNTGIAIKSGSFGSGQDRYVSVTFNESAGSLGNGLNDYLEVDTRFNKTDNSYYDQSNDWSFAAYSSFTQWNEAGIYYDGTLVWGYEPGTFGILKISDKATPAQMYAEKMSAVNVYNYPNPCKDMTVIRFSLDKPADVNIQIRDINNKLVWQRKIKAQDTKLGINGILWDTTNETGKKTANGIYVYDITTGGMRVTKKIAVVR